MTDGGKGKKGKMGTREYGGKKKGIREDEKKTKMQGERGEVKTTRREEGKKGRNRPFKCPFHQLQRWCKIFRTGVIFCRKHTVFYLK